MSLAHMQNILDEALCAAGHARVEFSSAGMAEITIHGLRIALEYVEGIESLVLFSSLGTLPAQPSASFCEYLLSTNLMGGGTGGGHIGLGPDRTLVYSVTLDASNMDGARLANAFDRFAEKAAVLIAEVEEHGRSSNEGFSSSEMLNALWV